MLKSKSASRRFSVFLLTAMLFSVLPLSASAYGPITMFDPPSNYVDAGVFYGRAMQLSHNGVNNGKMYATFERYTPNNVAPAFPIYESANSGESWTKVGEVVDTQNGWGMRFQPFLFELPQAIGNLAAGTLLAIGNSIPADYSATKIDLYKSTDLGRNWTFVSSIATGGASSMGGDPVWEPFLMVANNKLIVYYSDERDPAYPQKIVHQTSTDGLNWGSVVNDVALSGLRPGMPVVAKMANGNYIMSYEIVGNGITSNYKISSNPESWNASDAGQIFSGGGSPYVNVLPNGNVILGDAASSDIYMNSNNGIWGWTRVPTPVSAGYSRALVPLSNGRLFIIQAGN